MTPRSEALRIRRFRGAASASVLAVLGACGLALAQTPPVVPAGSALTVTPAGQTIIVTPPGVNPDAGTPDAGGAGPYTPSDGGDFDLPWLTIDGGGRMYLSSG